MGLPYLLIVLLMMAMMAPISVQPYNILITALGCKSHKIVFDAVAEELARRGHQVTVLCAVANPKKLSGVQEVVLPAIYDIMEEHPMDVFNESNPYDESTMLAQTIDLFVDFVNVTYNTPLVRDILRQPRDANFRPKYDLVLVDAILHEFTLPLGHVMAVPTVYLTPFSILPPVAWSLNIPFPFAYLTNGLDPIVSPRTFYERATNLLHILGFFYFRNVQFQPHIDEALKKFVPNLPSLLELERNVSFLFTNSHPAVYASMPRMPYSAEVGCLHCKPANPLTKDLEDFMQSSGNKGVIYFSFGSLIKGGQMPQKLREKFIEAFAQLPQKVLWKYNEKIENLPQNVKTIEWAPQQDILGHPKLKAFLTHGGGLSMLEAAYHGVPLVGMPLATDEFCNMAHAESRGFALVMDVRNFSTDELVRNLNDVISDKRYKETALKLSSLMTDYMVKPTETVAYWLEYVIRHQGAHHLKSGAEQLNLFQYLLLDVIGAFLLVFEIVVLVVIALFRRLSRLLRCGSNQIASKKQKIN